MSPVKLKAQSVELISGGDFLEVINGFRWRRYVLGRAALSGWQQHRESIILDTTVHRTYSLDSACRGFVVAVPLCGRVLNMVVQRWRFQEYKGCYRGTLVAIICPDVCATQPDRTANHGLIGWVQGQ